MNCKNCIGSVELFQRLNECGWVYPNGVAETLEALRSGEEMLEVTRHVDVEDVRAIAEE